MTVPAAGGVPRVLKTIEGSVKRASWSPDGQFIIYDAPRVAGKPEHALFIMRADGSNSAVLIPRRLQRRDARLVPGRQADPVCERSQWNQRLRSLRVWLMAKRWGTLIREETLGGNIVQGQGFTRDGSYHYRTQGRIRRHPHLPARCLRCRLRGGRAVVEPLRERQSKGRPGHPMVPKSRTCRRRSGWQADLLCRSSRWRPDRSARCRWTWPRLRIRRGCPMASRSSPRE